MKIEIHTKTECPKCTDLKMFFDSNNIEYTKNIYDNDAQRKSFYKDISKKVGKEINTVPQIFINDKYIGGHSDFLDIAFDVLEGNYEG